jgi:DNA topoisomerase IA
MRTRLRRSRTRLQEQAHRDRGRFGRDTCRTSRPFYRTRSSTAQEAHEAIRPTSPDRDADSVRPFLRRGSTQAL